MDNDTLFDVFKIAIENERDAYNFYKKAAEGTPNEEVRQLFLEFAEIELGHERRLKEKYRELRGEAG